MKGILIIILVLVGLLAIGLTSFFLISNNIGISNSASEYLEAECNSLPLGEKEICYLETIDSEDLQISFEECEGFSEDQWSIELCKIYSAINSQDLKKCEQLKIGSQSLCYEEIGKKTRDYRACNKIEDGLEHDPYALKEICYQHIARHLEDPEICELIEYTGRKDGCYLLVALRSHEIDLCYKINNEREKTFCTKKVSILLAGPSYCHNNTEIDQMACYLDLERVQRSEITAKRKLNVEECKELKYKESQEICVGFIAKKTENPELCEQITTGIISADCYRNLAIIKKDSSYCEYIEDQESKQTCTSCFTGELMCLPSY
ncbi:MAG: hypothetical protein IIA87_00705 [Nanoarchaeota archaeon]|nr:hypothetical protein [Nanoarchaeota archaeon]